MSTEKPRPSKPGRRQNGLDAALTKSIIGSSNEAFATGVLKEVIQSLWTPSSLSEEQRQERGAAVFAALEGIGPRDELEGMLAAQMVATHSAAMDCLRRAVIEKQTVEGRDMALKYASKLMTIYARQLEALDKHRGKGQQRITVEHVTVNEGGQAIVGNVTTREGSASEMGRPAADGNRSALTHDPALTLPSELGSSPRTRQKTRARKS